MERTTSPVATAAIEPGVTKIRANKMWAAGFTGRHRHRWSDTGFSSGTTPPLKGQVSGLNGTTANHNYHWHDAIHSAAEFAKANATAPCDDDLHGTHTPWAPCSATILAPATR